MSEPNVEKPAPKPDKFLPVLRALTFLVLAAVVLFVGFYGYAYLVSPASIRSPQSTHYHFRLQIINDGHAVNFADSAFQTEFNKDICTVELTKSPFHFHDNIDQFVHVHWAKVTGGLLLKNYGWNFIGGTPGVLGYRMSGADFPQVVPIHGHNLPNPPKDAHYYVYTGTPGKFTERNWDDFLRQDTRDFLKGTVPTTFLDRLVPAVYAHGDGDGHDTAASTLTDEQKLQRINNFQGDVVIFVQKDKPTADQVKARFEHVVPLPTSQCAG